MLFFLQIQNNVSTGEEQICIRINNIKNLNLLCKPEFVFYLYFLHDQLIFYFIRCFFPESRTCYYNFEVYCGVSCTL